MTSKPNPQTQQTTTTGDDYVTDLYLANRFSTKPQFWRKLRREGGGPKYCRLSGRAIRYRLSDVESWISERMCQNTGEY